MTLINTHSDEDGPSDQCSTAGLPGLHRAADGARRHFRYLEEKRKHQH